MWHGLQTHASDLENRVTVARVTNPCHCNAICQIALRLLPLLILLHVLLLFFKSLGKDMCT